jgi:hypothetical protein
MVERNQDIGTATGGPIYPGEDVTLTVSVEDASDGTEYDLSNVADINYAIGEEIGTTTFAKSQSGGGITVTDPAAGKFEVQLSASDTASLTPDTEHVHQASINDGDGTHHVVLQGSVQVANTFTETG